MRWNIHKKNYLMSMILSELIDETGIFNYIFQNKISKLIMLFILLADVFFFFLKTTEKKTINMVHQSIIILKCTRLCPANEHLKPCYGKWTLRRHSDMRTFYLPQAIHN